MLAGKGASRSNLAIGTNQEHHLAFGKKMRANKSEEYPDLGKMCEGWESTRGDSDLREHHYKMNNIFKKKLEVKTTV